MKIKVAEHSGFCFGVKRAINIANEVLDKAKNNIYSLGPIIHNPQVVDELSQKGLCVAKDIGNIKKGTVIISSHGAPKDIIQRIKKEKIKLVDATCPFVRNAHNIVKRLKKQGYTIEIIGDREHPEVKALIPLTLSPSPFPLPKGERVRVRGRGQGEGVNSRKIAIISQTTQNKENYLRGISDLLKEDFKEVRVFNTICNDTSRRQALTRKLLEECDVMIVVGGKNSANTKRLWQICRAHKVDSYHIELDSELKKDYLVGKRCVGVVSGASTPDAMVRKVVERIKTLTANFKSQITNNKQ